VGLPVHTTQQAIAIDELERVPEENQAMRKTVDLESLKASGALPRFQRHAKRAAHAIAERQAFEHRGFSERTIKVLLDCGIDSPERLLFMANAQLRAVPGLGRVSLGEIKRYRLRFTADR
jgi:DNA-directed RNA polymerase alpha subunit